MAPRPKRNASKPKPVVVSVPVADELVSLEVTGPMCLLGDRDPVLRKVKKSLKIREVVGKFVSASKLVGYRATTIKGATWNSVGLDTTIEEFIAKSYKRAAPIIKMRLLKPRTEVSAKPTPEIVTIDDEDEVGEAPTAMGALVDDVMVNLEGLKEDGGEMEGGGDDQASDMQPPPMEPRMGASVTSPSPPPARVTPDDQKPGSSRAMREAMARERVRKGRPVPPPPPPPSSSVVASEKRGVRVKKEAASNIKKEFEMPDAASTIANLKSRGVSIENMKELTQTRIRQFNNPFLLLARQEMRDLQRNVPGCPEWQKVVAKAPKCAYLLNELFRPLKDGQI